MTYARRPLHVPRLAGLGLRAAVFISRGFLGGAVRRKFLKDVGIDQLRAAALDAAPAGSPKLPVAVGADTPIDLAPLLCARPAAKGFAFETAAQFGDAYRERRLSPVDVAERLIAAIEASERHTPPLRALIAHDEQDLLRQAQEAKARFDAGQPRGPLDGVPVAVKDEVDMVPYPTSVGTRFLGHAPATRDATTVERLRAAGALLFGKTNMHEIGITPTGLNPHHGACRNPYDLTRDPGGSSSGVACAVAAGFAPLGLGADGGGSIRIPAAHCGLVGLKPTFGRISEHGAAPLCWSVGHLGPMGATALDCALGYAVLAGKDENDAQSQSQPAPTLKGLLASDLRGLRLGVPRAWFEDADVGVVRSCRQMLEALIAAGATAVEVEVPKLELLQVAHVVTITSEMLASQRPYLAAHRKDYGLNVQLILALVEGLSGADYVQAQRVRAESQASFAEILSRVDVIVTPTSAVTAPRLSADSLPHGESNVELIDALMRFVRPGNLLGLPSISFPAGYDEDGLPVGFMATGRPWEEALLLRLAYAAEALVEKRPPRYHHTLLT